MVFIKRLEMRGFKSFGDKKVSVPLDRGLTVVTGPNGSGKSNIFDAIRFTLGDLSARSLRADKMSEVIYDGSSSGGPNRTAYVSIQLDNADRRIPVDTETVTIARRVNKEGESDYFLNGKQAARSQLVDMLSMAGLSSNGYNMILQGTITRLADVTPEERRKAIEELVGIADYDAKKTDARLQLQQSEINLKIAEARLGDVQARLERLEEERNDALRHNFIQLELKKLRAIQLSHRILQICEEEAHFRGDSDKKRKEVEDVRKQREILLLEHDQMETKRRKFDEEVVDRGSTRLVEVQKTIGEIMGKIAAYRMEIESGNASLKGLTEVKRERLEQLSNLEKRLAEGKEVLPRLKIERDELKKILDEKSIAYERVSSKLMEMKQSFGAQARRMRELEDELGKLSRTVNRIDSNTKSNETRKRLITESLKSLRDKTLSYEETLVSLQGHLNELRTIYEDGKKSVIELTKTFEKYYNRKENLTTEIAEGETTIQLAREAVVEFEAQREVAERFLSEEAALQRIEEMVQEGALL
ncbi:AAA family ATPase, partial [Candidatus Bathyarchaeota archaeon]|nr:AAA family ATPase [Candidatus Bathyarchaeota archaeon]